MGPVTHGAATPGSSIGSVFRRLSLTLASLCLAVAACGSSGSEPEASAPAASSVLTGEFATISGGQLELNSLEGQDVVLWFWAPW